jgi:hypothetical protein
LPFALNTFVFDNGVRFLGFLRGPGKGAMRRLGLELVWNRRNELMCGTQVVVQSVVEFWLRQMPRLESVWVEVRYHDRRAVVGGSERVDLIAKLGAAMGRLKRMIEDERPGIECTVRAVGAAHPG